MYRIFIIGQRQIAFEKVSQIQNCDNLCVHSETVILSTHQHL